MSNQKPMKSLSLVALLLLSILSGLAMLPSASAVNETTSGTITGTETWSGTMNLQGDIEVAEGAKLIVNGGATVNIPYGTFIDVKGAICIGDSSCGATTGSSSNQARFVWTSPPAGDNRTGRCYSESAQVYNSDLACGSGMIIRRTIDQSITSLNYAHFENAYGYPIYVPSLQAVQYGALIFDGSTTTATGLSFKDVNTSNVLAIDFAAPHLRDSSFTLGIDGQEYDAAAVRAYDAGAGILSTFKVTNSVFTGDSSKDCGSSGGGRSLIFIQNSYIGLDQIEVKDNTYGAFLKGSSGFVKDSTFNTKCNAFDTNSHKSTGDLKHDLTVTNNTITTDEGAGLTAYDGARVIANDNVISGASGGSGVGIRDSNVVLNRNTIGPIGGWNGLWIYGNSDVSAENNTIQDTAKEPVLIGEYHFKDQGWNVPQPSAARLYLANNQISNNTGTCNSVAMYGGDFPCPALHVFMSSATIMNNVISGNAGDILRAKGSIVNVQDNTADSQGGFAANISHYDDNYGNKYGTIGYFSGNTWTNASQIYNITESRVTVQSEYIPSPGNGELYPVNLAWLGAECPWVQDECLQVPQTKELPPKFMPLALEVVDNSTVFSFADLQNFDITKIHVQSQNSAWGSQVREGELVRYQVKAKNSNVAGATVVIKDSTGLPLYELETDAFGFTDEVSLPSNFYLDRNWNHVVGESNVQIPGTSTWIDEDSCADGYDNDGDTYMDDEDPDCQGGGREMSYYSVEAYKFGKGTKEFSYTLTGPIDEVINLENLKPGVTVDQPDGFSFATTVSLTGTAWDGIVGPYANDHTAYEKQFGTVKRVEIQPPGSTDWYTATDNSGAEFETVTQTNHPNKYWSFDWDMSAHPEGETDVTFRVRSYDGLDYSPVEVRKFKLNLVAPTTLVNTPNDGSTHDSGEVTFTGTASDPYSGTWGSDIQAIWFDITGPENNDGVAYHSHFSIPGSTAWSYDWQFDELISGEYTFNIWASDSDFCIDTPGDCTPETRTLTIMNENAVPFVQLSEPLNMDVIRADEETLIQGVARDNDGQVTRVEIEIFDLASGYALNDGPNPVTTFAPNGAWATYWDTSDLIHDYQYEIVVKAYDGEDYSQEERIRITIDNPLDRENVPPTFNSTAWMKSITIFCDAQSNSIERCGDGASIDLSAFFQDPDGATGEPASDLVFDIFDDSSTVEDDDFAYFVTISSDGVATYNPPYVRSDSNIAEWSLVGLMFEARDAHDSVVYSAKVNILVSAVSFAVERDDSGIVTPDDPATFSGQGLPGSTVIARHADGNLRINSTRVLSDGTWAMDLSSSQIGSDGSTDIIFEMDGQVYTAPGDSDETTFTMQVGDDAESSSGMLNTILIVVGILVLLGVGAFFFIEFEDIDDEEGLETAAGAEQAQEDPYAWAKAKQTPDIPAAAVATTPVAPAAAQPVAQEAAGAASQHPGWLWDAESNQWVPDPNYQG